MRIIALALLLAGCGGKKPAETPPEATVTETIDETTVGDLDGTRVAMGSMLLSDTYKLPDGSEKKGITCNLALPGDEKVWVGLGSEVLVDGVRWEVVAIVKERGEAGSVTLAKR